MFIFHYTNRLKCLLRNRTTVFWTLLFPIMLATLFHIAFGSITQQSEEFSPVAAAVVDNQAYRSNANFQKALKSVSTGDKPRLIISVTDESEADRKLKDGEITGIIKVSDTISLRVRKTGINESILKAFLDQYQQTEKTVMEIMKSNPSAAQNGLFDAPSDRRSYVREITFSGSKPDTMLNYFYALIAMACLYGSFWGLRNATDIQADLSPLGARRSVAPTHKLTAVVSDELAGLTIHFAEILLTLFYLAFVLKVDFGTRWGYVILTCLVGSIAGVSFGTFVGSAVRKNETMKNAMMIGFSMLFSFLAGLMIANIKQIVAQNVPILGYINPAALITDAFYSLILAVISVLFAAASYLFVRREKYASL